MVCDIKNRNCMLLKCEQCPGPQKIKDYLCTLFEDVDDVIAFSQWSTVDRVDIVSEVASVRDVIDLLVSKLYTLLPVPQLFISTTQTQYFKERKLRRSVMFNGLCRELLFVENYSLWVLLKGTLVDIVV